MSPFSYQRTTNYFFPPRRPLFHHLRFFVCLRSFPTCPLSLLRFPRSSHFLHHASPSTRLLRHLPYTYASCPLHSAGSSHTTYVPRASELVATAGRSLDYAPSLFHHHPTALAPRTLSRTALTVPPTPTALAVDARSHHRRRKSRRRRRRRSPSAHPSFYSPHPCRSSDDPRLPPAGRFIPLLPGVSPSSSGPSTVLPGRLFLSR